ncbi:tripartite tricarboxylate transporter permease [Bacillus litorisediminis]|uniref:tripartite tricarboxylate transporter permease n=1 Tax=Bacillus litorisediminis TaxID=2922713 RepID=UPI001FB006AC|nr:tripartite tricarboxylate transporter permease [Bacillus litorisediminis]
METIEYLFSGFAAAMTGWNLLYCLIGVTVGMLVGILPGLGPSAGTAILIPLTIGMEPISAIVMLAGIYYGAMYGGTITSVLINTPGEAASVVTAFDGYPMAKQGRAGAALGTAAIGSFIGGIVAIIGLVLVGPALAKFALNFGPPEYFALMLFGATMVIGLMGKSLLRGAIAAIIGLTLATVGMDPVTGMVRFSFGQINLMEGFDFVTIAMGLFGLSEILHSAEQYLKAEKPPKLQGLLPKKEEWKPTMLAITRGTGIGFGIGLIPGTNSVIPPLISYSVEKKLAKDPSRFGNGAIEGVAGPETANNAYSGAALIPLFTLGLPSSPTIAILLGAFIMHGLTPGPSLFSESPDFVWAVIASMFIGNLLLLIMNLPLAGIWANITRVPFKILFPIILIVLITGTYTINNSLFDVGVMLMFGVIGYLFKKVDIPLAPLVLMFVLGQLMEDALLQSLTITGGDFFSLFTRPIAGTLFVLSIIVLALSTYAELTKKKGMFADDLDM